jgi:hypothetical protein
MVQRLIGLSAQSFDFIDGAVDLDNVEFGEPAYAIAVFRVLV